MEQHFAKVMGGDGGDKETSGCQMDREEIGLEFSQWLCEPISGEEIYTICFLSPKCCRRHTE